MTLIKPAELTIAMVSMDQALDIWSELEQAYHGTNSFGGHDAEIYAYRLLRNNPTAHYAAEGSQTKLKAVKEDGLAAAWALYGLLMKFARDRDARILVGGRKLGRWLVKEPFVHRCHVTIRPPARRECRCRDCLKPVNTLAE